MSKPLNNKKKHEETTATYDMWASSSDDEENKHDMKEEDNDQRLQDDASDDENNGEQVSQENSIKEMLDKADDDKPIFLLSQFPSEMEVKFITENYPLKVSENAFKVPSNFTRFGLSEVINQLLIQEHSEENHPKHVPFEFLIEYKPGKKIFLRTSLAKFFTKLQIWPESAITLEYIEAQPAPKCVDSIPHDDWVSALSLVLHTSGSSLTSNVADNQYLISGCYDGVVRVIDTTLGKIVHQTKQSKVPITGLATCYIAEHHTSSEDKSFSVGDILIAGCGKDEYGRVWVSNPSEEKMRMKMLLNGHTDTVNDICLHPRGTMICTASEDRSLKLWQVDLTRSQSALFYENNLPANDENDDDEDYKEPTKKKKKMPSQIQQYAPIGTMERKESDNQNGHLLGVTCVKWIEGGRIVSGSSDHTIRVWDVATGVNSITLNGSKVVTSISVKDNSDSTSVLSSHPDFLIRLWDARQGGSKKASLFRSHRGWVRKVKWVSDFQFISGGDDNVVKLWDIRSGIPIHSTPHSVNPERKTISTDKVLSIEGFAPLEGQIKEQHNVGQLKYHLFSGSTDCTLKKHTMSQ
ncbi:hypothetical protein C9374_014105 [Naegleria lovaniensis]|uniref:NLE domain-containing protein n=1 Tax=Naegleria lovaniensis TaxID=51637 RepID=A0AA88KN11_NAELO|nr:uncharacterized protein C9374_014105 [Naegleria lovaniensis]KAG2389545.1 hypothetical protein C9374_014105 [Naegleria lovaniensis]